MTEKLWDIVISGYVSMDHILKIRTPAQVGFSSLISNKSNTRIYYGGCPVNISYALCRLGIRAIPLLRVGNDYESTGFRSFLEQGRVPTAGICLVEGEATSVCYLIQDNDGQHITLFYPGSMDGKYARPIDESFFRASGMGLLTVGAYEDNREFFAGIKRNHLPLAFGMKSDRSAFPTDFLREVLYYSSIVFTNEDERKEIEKTFHIELTDLLTKGNVEILITTLGKRGSRYYYKNKGQIKSAELPICDCGPPVDTAGSGDAYIAGFLYGYWKGLPVRECALLGTVLSSFVIEQEGCCTGLPWEDALLKRRDWFEKKIHGGI
jgi:adenosine kinase